MSSEAIRQWFMHLIMYVKINAKSSGFLVLSPLFFFFFLFFDSLVLSCTWCCWTVVPVKFLPAG